MRIGLDFDNTLTGYDHIFAIVAKRLGLLSSDFTGGKQAVKSALQAVSEESWMRVQGQVYGRYMSAAEFLPGAAQFIARGRKGGCEFYIVSHKTRHGHFDEANIDLHQAALSWMEGQGFFDKDKLGFSRDQVFFCPTRDEKIEKISELELDVFVDDLKVVFDDPAFPAGVQKILYGPMTSWTDISAKLFKGCSQCVDDIAQCMCPESVIEISDSMNSGNNQLYKVTTAQGDFALKLYLDDPQDNRNRLASECNGFALLRNLGEIQVPDVIARDDEKQAVLFPWVDGQAIITRSEQDWQELLAFVKRLSTYPVEGVEKAAEACLSATDLIRQVERRLNRLQDVACLSTELESFLGKHLLPGFEDVRNVEGRVEKLILSPSDFGFHNALRKQDGTLVFLDFEYFGVDDPVKLAADTILHPAHSLGREERLWLQGQFIDIFSKTDAAFQDRLKAFMPLYVLRWCCIILNPFLPERWARHAFAGEKDRNAFCQSRLGNARRFFDEHWEMKEVAA